MGESITITGDKYLDESGVVVNGSGDTLANRHKSIVQLMSQVTIPTTATSYSCAWSGYDLLIICTIYYNNIDEAIVVPTSYFAGTSTGGRVQIYSTPGSNEYDVYQNGNNAVYIKANTSVNNRGVRIYGVKLGI